MDRKPGIAAIPLRSVAPKTMPAKSTGFETKPMKFKKEESTVKSPNQVVSELLRRMQSTKKASASKKSKKQCDPGTKVEKKNPNEVFSEANLGVSRVPPPYCSCTGIARVCHKCGSGPLGGWQSTCCTNNMSEYPLPMSPTRPGARITGRKMRNGAYEKLLFRLAAEGLDLSHPVDLKDHWARPGTNKFVTIK